MKKTAFITGVAGQDGSYLAEHLLDLGYRVTGIVRRNSTVEHQRNRVAGLPLELEYGDLTDQSSLERALRMFKPDEIYNLGAQSHVRISSDIPQFTAQTNSIGVLNLLEAYKNICPQARFYQASSSEMFGKGVDEDLYQRETTPMKPVSPYGCSKVFAYNIVRHYREAFKLHASNGILFNHESPRRGSNFVTNKVVKGAVEIKLGLTDKLEMGNMDSYRDWGHSYDYVRAMHKIINHSEPIDLVVATGETRSVRDMCNYVFGKLDLDYSQYVVQNEKYLRPEELPYLRGDSSKLRSLLDWEPTYTFEQLMDEMIAYWMDIYQKDLAKP
jgi:GDPmannose 4,6-dehydratase